jgi:hypothetical protein
MTPRSDFTCSRCDVTMELPIAATVCPVCSGPLERIFSANVATKVDRTFNKAVVDPALEAAAQQRSAAKDAVIQRERGLRNLARDAAAAAVARDPGAAVASRSIAVPAIRALGLPMPGMGSKFA